MHQAGKLSWEKVMVDGPVCKTGRGGGNMIKIDMDFAFVGVFTNKVMAIILF